MAAESYWFFNSTGEDQRKYDAFYFAEYFKDLYTNGVFRRTEDALQVTAAGGMALAVADGSAAIQGYRYKLEGGDKGLNVPLAAGTNRTDRVVLRLSLVDNTIRVLLKQGGTQAPGLERSGTVWELSLARMTVRAGSAALAAGDIVDERTDPNLCGWVRNTPDPAYYPSGSLPELLWRYTMFPQSMTAAERSAVEGNSTLMSAFQLGRLKQLSDGLDTVADAWVRIAAYQTAGAFTYTVPAGITLLGAYLGGGGGSGGAAYANGTADGYDRSRATGGASGCFRTVSPVAVTPGGTLSGTVGAGGAPVSVGSERAVVGSQGGTTTFLGQSAVGGDGGQVRMGSSGSVAGAYGGQSSCGDPNHLSAYAGGFMADGGLPSRCPRDLVNPYEPFRVNGAAGSGGSGRHSEEPNAEITHGEAATSSYGTGGVGVSHGPQGGNATGNCNGGGGVASGKAALAGYGATSGAGSPGMVLIYARRSEALAAGVNILA